MNNPFICSGCEIVLPPYKISDIWASIDDLPIKLVNVLISKCSNCEENIIYPIKSEVLMDAIACALASWPIKLSGQYFKWFVNYLLQRVPTSELLACWAGCDDFYLKTGQEKLIKLALQKRLGLSKASEFNSLGKMEELPEGIDEIVKSILRIATLPEDKCSTDIIYSSNRNCYFIVIDFKKLSQKLLADIEALIKEQHTRLLSINDFYRRLKKPLITAEKFLDFLYGPRRGKVIFGMDDLNIFRFCCFVYYVEKNQSAYACRMLIDENYLDNKDFVAKAFLYIFDYARKKGAKQIILEKPVQRELLKEAGAVGFLYRDSNSLKISLSEPNLS